MADSMTAELKRALVETACEAFPDFWAEQSDEDKDYYRRHMWTTLCAVFARLAAGSPEVIEAMARARCHMSCEPSQHGPGCASPAMCWDWRVGIEEDRAALAAGMKAIADGGK